MIHQSGNTLERKDRQRLESTAASEEDKILRLMRCRPDTNFTAFEMAELTRIRKGNCRRALSNMSGSDSGKYRDEFGNYVLIKNEHIRRRDPETGVRVVTYQYNKNHGKRTPEPRGQLSILDELTTMV